VKNLTRSLKEQGHHVEVLAGPPDPLLDQGIPVHHLPGLDLYNSEDPFRMPSMRELMDPVNFMEWAGVSTMGFPEPFTFGIRAHRFLKRHGRRFDIVHDNQSLSYGLWSIQKSIPTVATIHHPITVDRDIAVRSVRSFWKKLKHLRWYSFIGMQKRVAPTISRIITVSRSARNDIRREFNIAADRFRVIPNGINTDLFYPIPEIQRETNRIIVTNSADTPLKGLYYLLQAIESIAKTKQIKLVVVGTPKKNGGIVKLIRRLGIGHLVRFTGRISEHDFVRQYARATMAVVPSVYEGFGLPVGEAMACGVPVISTSGGALPEVVGNAGILVKPADHGALAAAINDLLDNPDRAVSIGRAGYRRVHDRFTWKKAAEKTVATYREVIRDHSGL
jgi:glycosyltransferase involved in cell wall biosynthesis